MITKEQALTATMFYHVSKKQNKGKQPLQVRRTGQTQTWKRNPERFKIPVKFGLYESGYITEQNAHEWTTEIDWAMKKLSVKFGHSNIWPNEQSEGIKTHTIEGVNIEVQFDGGNWWVEEVSINGEIANALDTPDPSNFEGPSNVREMLSEGIPVEEACERAGAKWMVEMNSYRYFFFE